MSWKRYRKTGGGLLGVWDKVKKPLGGILAAAAILTMLGFAGHDNLTEAQRKAKGVENDAYEGNSLEIEAIIEEPEITRETGEQEPEWTSLGEFTVTHYCPCETCCGQWAKSRPVDADGKEIVYTASGARAEEGVTIAVDPDVIPIGTQVRIDGHIYTAQDTGNAIKGNKIDIYMENHEAACKGGRFKTEVEVRA